MVLQEKNYKQKINSMTRADWQPLFNIIPEIEKTRKFGEVAGGKTEDGSMQFPFHVPSPIVEEFHKLVYDIPVVVSFDWSSWQEGREILNNPDFDFDKLDVPDKCRLITIIVRSDRFSDGALVEAFESGVILKILKSIRCQVK